MIEGAIIDEHTPTGTTFHLSDESGTNTAMLTRNKDQKITIADGRGNNKNMDEEAWNSDFAKLVVEVFLPGEDPPIEGEPSVETDHPTPGLDAIDLGPNVDPSFTEAFGNQVAEVISTPSGNSVWYAGFTKNQKIKSLVLEQIEAGLHQAMKGIQILKEL